MVEIHVQLSFSIIMWKYFIKSVFTNIKRNKVFSFLNISGLAIGIAAAMLILLWVESQFSWNKQFNNLSQIYQVERHIPQNGEIKTTSVGPGPLAEEIKNKIPEITFAAPVATRGGLLVSDGNKHLYFDGKATNQDFFSIFNFHLLKGTLKNIFSHPDKIVVTEKVAKAFFGEGNPIGQSLKLDNETSYTVQAVIESLPDNMDFDFDILLPFDLNEPRFSWLKDWGNSSPRTFVSIAPNANVLKINKELRKALKGKQDQNFFSLYPFKDMHLYGEFNSMGQPSGAGKITMVRLFSCIALAILLIACINFMNLSTARATQRAKEVGIRKVLGAKRRILIFQFMGEAIVYATISVLFALVIVRLALPSFSQLIGVPLLMQLFEPAHLFFIVGICLFCGLIAGSYPALFLSGFLPINNLRKQKINGAGSAGLLRKTLVVFQFSLSIILIIATFVIYRQIQFTKNRSLGFNQDQVLSIPHAEDIEKKYPHVRQSLLAINDVENVSMCTSTPYSTTRTTTNLYWKGRPESVKTTIAVNFASADFLRTLNIPVVSGTQFQPSKTDSTAVIINEAMARQMGKEGKIGSLIQWGTEPTNDKYRIVGICKDFVHDDIHALQPGPMVLIDDENGETGKSLYIRLRKETNIPAALGQIKTIFSSASPDYPFEYHFLDEEFDELFQAQTIKGNLSMLFGGLSIFISCLGLFGLTAFMAEQRTKEIGIRKILGASVFSILRMLSGSFLKLVFLAGLISIPVALLFTHNWLQQYPYRITVRWWLYGSAILLTVIIAATTIFFHALKAAKVNPVESLHSE
ncbi:duplicated orphan permease [Arachidicoccus rhizosphaerae]|uniref:Duplicated orphan permease n=1 Tax=Arachidicoccus rhizosphaerae TaxID=551991 RepID=A0A1H3YUW7_9BACT|nr:duplicated orphan permease [Arachidicoccus rhizosphaerae]